MQSTWKGLLDGVMGRTDAQKKDGGSGVLTPKSRVKLGDLSVSPMGELLLVWSLCTYVARGAGAISDSLLSGSVAAKHVSCARRIRSLHTCCGKSRRIHTPALLFFSRTPNL